MIVLSLELFKQQRILTFALISAHQFLDRCTNTLHMISAARRLFDEDGTEHWSLKDLKRDQLVYVTAGEPFVNVCRAQQEMRLRTFFNSLSSIVDRAARYVSLVDQMSKGEPARAFWRTENEKQEQYFGASHYSPIKIIPFERLPFCAHLNHDEKSTKD